MKNIGRRKPWYSRSWSWACSAFPSFSRLPAPCSCSLRGSLLVLLVATAAASLVGEEAYLRGMVLFKTGHPMEAGLLLESAHKWFPLQTRIRESRMRWVVLWGRASRDEALAVVDSFLATDPASARTLALRRGLTRQRP